MNTSDDGFLNLSGRLSTSISKWRHIKNKIGTLSLLKLFLALHALSLMTHAVSVNRLQAQKAVRKINWRDGEVVLLCITFSRFCVHYVITSICVIRRIHWLESTGPFPLTPSFSFRWTHIRAQKQYWLTLYSYTNPRVKKLQTPDQVSLKNIC